MSDAIQNPFGITREEILELAANKLADQYADKIALSASAAKITQEHIDSLIKINTNNL